MTLTHLHIMINHLPLFGSAIAVVLLAWAVVARSRDLTRAGFVLVAVCGIAAYAAHWTGDGAEHQVEDLPWAQRELIHEHEEAADWALWILAAAAVVSAAGLYRMRKEGTARQEATAVLVLVVFGFAASAKTALEGGKIRHEEVRPGFVFPR